MVLLACPYCYRLVYDPGRCPNCNHPIHCPENAATSEQLKAYAQRLSFCPPNGLEQETTMAKETWEQRIARVQEEISLEQMSKEQLIARVKALEECIDKLEKERKSHYDKFQSSGPYAGSEAFIIAGIDIALSILG